MESERRQKLIECIRKDDVVTFGELMTPEVLSCVFGRFPVLSLLYLYGAKRIVKRYYPDLIKERPRVKEEPFREADKLFAKQAGKCLRYYISADVSPPEMLAVLGRGRELEKLYPVYPGASRALPMIHNIYFTRLGEGVVVTGDKLSVPREPLSFATKRALLTFSVLFFAVFLVIAAVTSAIFVYYGAGSAGSYFRVRNEGNAIAALREDNYIKLESDISLSAGTVTYSASMDGGGHIVRLSSPFAEKVTGEIRDVIFVLEEGFTGDAVILENSGVLENVRVVATNLTLAKAGEYMGLLTANNSGTIKGCTAVTELTISGEGNGDCFFAPFAGCNDGLIHDCLTDCKIEAKNVDVAGVAGKNGESGVISDCVVKGEFYEICDIKNWTPNVAGVAAQNDGSIYGTVVTGTVTSALSAPVPEDDDHLTSAYAAGITCVNGGSVKECENRSEVFASATNGYALAGGIVTINVRYDTDSVHAGKVESSRGKGPVKATSSTHAVYAGGIAAENPQGGEIRDCTVSESVLAVLTMAEGSESVPSVYAGGVTALNLNVVAECRVNAPVTATADQGHSFAGGVVALNAYVNNQKYYSVGSVTGSLCGGDVLATSVSYNACAGGVVAENNQGQVSSCGQTAAVSASSGDDKRFSYIGGVVGYNYGVVEKSFFIGTISDYDATNLVGGICGLLCLPFQMGAGMDQNYFSAGAHVSGATLFMMNYYDLRAGSVYSLYFLENNEGYEKYITPILDYGGEGATVQEIKAKEVYYE